MSSATAKKTKSKISGAELMKQIESDDRWDNGELGNDAQFARKVSAAAMARMDKKAGLKAISIRLPNELIETLKLIGQFHGVGYQPLVRDLLVRFAESEVKQILRQLQSATKDAKLDKRHARQTSDNPTVERSGTSRKVA